VQHLGRFAAEQLQEATIGLFAGGILNVFNDVELDVAGTQDLQRTPGLASIGVVVDGHIRHGWGLLE